MIAVVLDMVLVHLLPTTRESAADWRHLWPECERVAGTGPIQGT